MEHPGQPRFCAVGETVELAPRDPDPDADYEWSIASTPEGSEVDVDERPVQRLAPDVPGRYRFRLRTPDETFEVTVRAFSEELRPGWHGSGGGAYSGDVDADEGEDALAGAAEEAPEATSGGGSGLRTRGVEDDDAERPRVHLRTAVTDDDVVVEAAVRPRPERGSGREPPSVEFLLDDRDDLSAADVTVEGSSLRIPRERLGERARVHAVALGEHAYSVPDTVDVRRERSGGAAGDGAANAGTAGDAEADDAAADDGAGSAGRIEVSRPYDPPEWALDTTIYEIYVRTFDGEDGERPPFAAIRERLDELDELGIETLWLTPVLQHDGAPHGYNIVDFLSIASDLGGREEYERLIDAAHDRGMRVLFDLVCNHSARAHPFFEDAYRNPDSEYYSWYDWQENGEPGTYFDWERIANFDFRELAVRRHLLDAVDTWAPMVDGFRCDMAWAVPNAFWMELHDRVKAADSEFFLLDETIPYIPDFQGGLFDMHFDSTTAFCLREIGAGNQPAEAMLDAVDERRRIGFPEHASFMLYHENHDESRYLASYGEASAFASAGALATLPGAPMVYAGQETGQLGKRDPLRRGDEREDLRSHYRRLLALRAERPALRHRADLSRVDYEVHEGHAPSVVAFGRETRGADEGVDEAGGGVEAGGHRAGTGGEAPDDAVVTLLNFAPGEAEVSVEADVGGEDLVTGEAVVDGGTVAVDNVVVLPVR